MEYIGSEGGMGLFGATVAEERMFGQLERAVASHTTPKNYRTAEQQVHATLHDLFPAFAESIDDPKKLAENRTLSFGNQYRDLDNGGLYVQAEVLLPRYNERCRKLSETLFSLKIMSGRAGEYRITVARPHQPACLDGLVTILGTRKLPSTPFIEGLQPLPAWEEWYGFAQVHLWATIVDLYHKASQLLQKAGAPETISYEQLEVLRQDAFNHENLAIRDLSWNRYQNELQKLARLKD